MVHEKHKITLQKKNNLKYLKAGFKTYGGKARVKNGFGDNEISFWRDIPFE